MSTYTHVFPPLGKNEKKDYTVDFVKNLSDMSGTLVDSISTYSVTARPDTVTITGLAKLSDTQLIFYVSQPDPVVKLYDLIVQINTTVGRTYEELLGLPTDQP